MNISIIIAQVLGITFTVLGLSLFTNKKASAALLEEAVKNKTLLWVFGFISLTMGAVMISLNNFWTSGLPLFITILGWLTLLKGVGILVFPNSSDSFYRKVKKENTMVFAGLVVFIIGLILLYNGF